MDTTWEILTWSREEEIYCDGDQTLEQVAQRDHVISFLGDFYSPTERSPEVTGSTLSRKVALDDKGSFPS